MHHALLAHAAAHDVFKDLKKKGRARGTFGIKIDGQPAKPLHKNNEADKEAALRHMEFVSMTEIKAGRHLCGRR